MCFLLSSIFFSTLPLRLMNKDYHRRSCNMQQGAAIKLKTCNEMGGARAVLAASCKLQQNANEGCNSCASLAGLIACFIVVVIRV